MDGELPSAAQKPSRTTALDLKKIPAAAASVTAAAHVARTAGLRSQELGRLVASALQACSRRCARQPHTCIHAAVPTSKAVLLSFARGLHRTPGVCGPALDQLVAVAEFG